MTSQPRIPTTLRGGLHSETEQEPATARQARVALSVLNEDLLRPVLAAVLDERLAALERRLFQEIRCNRHPSQESSSLGPLVTEREIATMLNCNPRTVRRLELGGQIPPALRIGGSKRWRKGEVEQWLDRLGRRDRTRPLDSKLTEAR